MGITNPSYFPKGESWKQVFGLERKNCETYPYTDAKGNILFVVYADRTFASTKGKKIQQFSYVNGKYVKENAWTKVEGFKMPLYRSYDLANTNKPIILGEGESVVEKGQELFPEFFWTTFQGGRKAWKPHEDKSDRVNWSLLQGREVYVLPDVDADSKGKESFIELTRYLNDFQDVKAKFVKLPRFSQINDWYEEEHGERYPKKSWDVVDGFFDKYTEQMFLEDIKIAELPKPLQPYESTYFDVLHGKWIFIAKSGKLYYDTQRDTYAKAEEIDTLYKRDRTLRIKATTFLNQNKIDWVDQQTFRAGKPLIFEEGGLRLLNKYRKPKLPSILEGSTLDISIWQNHILNILANGDPKIATAIEDIIADDIRNPHKNRTFATIFFSGQGVGKTLFFNGLKKLYGEKNCSDLSLDQLVGRYQPFMLSSCYLFINEIDSTGKDVKSKQAMLRALISDTNFMVEMKGIDLIPISNCSYTIWGATNESVPMYLPQDDRRTFFVDIATTRYEVLRKDPDYYSKYAKFVSDPLSMAHVYNFYLKIYKISNSYNRNEAPATSAKQELIEASKPQYMKTLDEYASLPRNKQPIASLQRDIVNAKQLTADLVKCENEDIRKEFYTENKVLRWIRSYHKNFRILKGEPYPIPNSNIRGRCWVIRNHEIWVQFKNDKERIDQHLNKKLETLDMFQQMKGKKYDEIPF